MRIREIEEKQNKKWFKRHTKLSVTKRRRKTLKTRENKYRSI